MDMLTLVYTDASIENNLTGFPIDPGQPLVNSSVSCSMQYYRTMPATRLNIAPDLIAELRYQVEVQAVH
jgi:hypothetical protein